jgi:hypothetical protein
MGGEVFVGVRYRDSGGEVHEHCSLRWTNEMPRVLADIGFYRKGRALSDFIADAKPDSHWPQPVLTKEISPSEYGVILVDFEEKIIFSRQNYSGIGSYCAAFDEPEDRRLVTRLAKAKGVTSITTYRGDALPVMEVIKVLAQLARDREPRTDAQVVEYRIPGWEINHRSIRADECWPVVRSFVKEHGWRSRIWSAKRASKSVRVALAGIGVMSNG